MVTGAMSNSAAGAAIQTETLPTARSSTTAGVWHVWPPSFVCSRPRMGAGNCALAPGEVAERSIWALT